MIFREDKGVRWLEFELLQGVDDLVHAVFLSDEEIETKARSFCLQKGVPSIISPRQVHGDAVINAACIASDTGCDAIYCDATDTALFIRHADCQAALFYDPIRKVIANVHSGWRGNVQNIYGKTVATLQKEAGCSPSDLIVCISPSLGPERSQFIHYEKELPASFYPFAIRPLYFDFWRIATHQLMQSGVRKEHIEIAGLCTYDHPELFYSYRRDKTTKRNITMIAIKGTRYAR
jgi:YfiH family protein